jgi:hypothetical protein
LIGIIKDLVRNSGKRQVKETLREKAAKRVRQDQRESERMDSLKSALYVPGHEPRIQKRYKYTLEPIEREWGWITEDSNEVLTSNELVERIIGELLDLDHREK